VSGKDIPRLLSYGVSGIRFAVSGMFAAKPSAMLEQLYGRRGAEARHAGLVARHYVVRDAALAIGLLRALRSGRDARAWMLAGTLADLFDLGTIAVVRTDRTQRAKLLAGMTAIVVADAVITAALAAGNSNRDG
jgi:hypothetical protein